MKYLNQSACADFHLLAYPAHRYAVHIMHTRSRCNQLVAVESPGQYAGSLRLKAFAAATTISLGQLVNHFFRLQRPALQHAASLTPSILQHAAALRACISYTGRDIFNPSGLRFINPLTTIAFMALTSPFSLIFFLRGVVLYRNLRGRCGRAEITFLVFSLPIPKLRLQLRYLLLHLFYLQLLFKTAFTIRHCKAPPESLSSTDSRIHI